MTKPQATYNDLLAWYIYHKCDHALDVSPEKIAGWIKQMESHHARRVAHRMLWLEYPEYQDAFQKEFP